MMVWKNREMVHAMRIAYVQVTLAGLVGVFAVLSLNACSKILDTSWKGLVATDSLHAGAFITKKNIRSATASTARLPADAINDPELALGKQVRVPMKPGQFLSLQDLDLPDVTDSHYDRILCATRAIPAGSKIDSSMTKVFFVNRSVGVGSCMSSQSQVIGKITLHSLAPHQALFPFDFLPEHKLLKAVKGEKNELVVYMKKDCPEGTLVRPENLEIQRLHPDDVPTAHTHHSIYEAAGWIAKYGISAGAAVDNDDLETVSDVTVSAVLK